MGDLDLLYLHHFQCYFNLESDVGIAGCIRGDPPCTQGSKLLDICPWESPRPLPIPLETLNGSF